MLHAIFQLLALKVSSPNSAATTPATTTRILICAPSHTAADVITGRLGMRIRERELFRLYSAERPVQTVPASILKYCQQDSQTGAFALPPASELMSYKVIVCTCHDAHLLYRVGVTNNQLRLGRIRFRNRLSTQCRASNLTAAVEGVDEPHFTHLFIDEAAQATEPEALIPISVVFDPVPGSRKVEVALVGDPRQLSPSVYSPTAQRRGLGRSYMERLLLRPVTALGGGKQSMLGPDMNNVIDFVRSSFRENLTTFLTLNYRGHPAFLMMPSALFYFDKLQSFFAEDKPGFWIACLREIECLSNPVEGLELENGLTTSVSKDVVPKRQFDWPIHFRGVAGKDKGVVVDSGFTSNSWSNENEAHAVVDIVLSLTSNNVSTESIGVMAPFRGQVVLIRKLLREKNMGGVNVGTVEDYQAVERDVIVLTLTRSTYDFVGKDIESRIGVFGQPKRSNVALTRAEHLLIVVRNVATPEYCFLRHKFSAAGESFLLTILLLSLLISHLNRSVIHRL